MGVGGLQMQVAAGLGVRVHVQGGGGGLGGSATGPALSPAGGGHMEIGAQHCPTFQQPGQPRENRGHCLLWDHELVRTAPVTSQ